MKTLSLDLNKRYTYADYLTWMDDVRRELYNGIINLMTPSPSRKHQRISTKLIRIIDVFWITEPVKFITHLRMFAC